MTHYAAMRDPRPAMIADIRNAINHTLPWDKMTGQQQQDATLEVEEFLHRLTEIRKAVEAEGSQ